MIVFVAPFPALSDEKDGFVQRIASIDSLVSDLPRVYLEISLRRFWTIRHHYYGKAIVLQLNAFRHFFVITSWFKKASSVYVHSVYGSLMALPAYWLATPITDLHGVVPEELTFKGKPWRARLLNLVERIALRRSATVVYVTSAMKQHFHLKYGRNSAADRIISILPKITDERGQSENVLGSKRHPKTVIYAGGLQPWQNVPLMIDAAAATPKFRFIFLSGEAEKLQRLAIVSNVADFTCISVEPEQVPDYYLSCTYGFVLRDPVLLNQVACPTKLVEYLHWGVIPVVLTPYIGDFASLGFAFVAIDEFRSGNLPDENKVARMRINNREVVERLRATCESELTKLSQELRRD